MPEALPELVPLALLFFCFAFVWAARKLLVGIFQPIIDAVHLVPYLGSALAGVLDAVVQALSNALGSVENGIDTLIGATWHTFAHFNRWLWREFTHHSFIAWLLAQEVSALKHAYSYVHGLVNDITHAHAHDKARIKRLEREYRGIEAQVKTLERDLSHGIGDDVLPRIKTLEREAAHIENVELPAAIAAQRQADSAISDLYEWAKGKAALVGVGTFALAVGVALDTLGLGNLRCPAFLRNLNRRGCNMWSGVEEMLGLFVDLFIVTDLCEVIPLLETAYEEVAAPAVGLLTRAIDAMPCVAGYQPPPLTVPALHLPSQPGLALSLP